MAHQQMHYKYRVSLLMLSAIKASYVKLTSLNIKLRLNHVKICVTNMFVTNKLIDMFIVTVNVNKKLPVLDQLVGSSIHHILFCHLRKVCDKLTPFSNLET